MQWYKLTIKETLNSVGTTEYGLSDEEAESRLTKFGPNQIEEEERTPAWLLLLEQFKSFLIILLIIAAGISIVIGEHIEAIAIMVIVILAGVLGFIQGYRAEKALEALKKMAALGATVVRDGKEKEIPAEDLVPGDIISLRVGDKIPADGRLLEAINMKTDEAPLTGESQTVDKTTQVLPGHEVPVGDRKNMVFMGTNVTYGRGKAVIVATGMETEFGKIARMLQEVKEPKTPLQISIDRAAKWIGTLAIIVSAVIGLVGIFRGYSFLEMFIWVVALVVAIVPEALPAVMTITLALGVRRMVKRNVLIRKLQAVETLGSTSIICSDKTGTLTEDQMTVRKIWVNKRFIEVDGVGYKPTGNFFIEGKLLDSQDIYLKKLLTIGALCNDSQLHNTPEGWTIRGDPTEGALLVAAAKAGINLEEIVSHNPRKEEIPFSSERKRMTTIHSTHNGIVANSKGALEVILDTCSYIYQDGAEREITHQDKENVLRCAHQMATGALRVLGMSYRVLNGHSLKEVESDMVFVGMVGMIDPPRKEAKEAIEVCKGAGIKPIMITGDHKLTAEAIAKELGILKSGLILTGTELGALTDGEFERIVEKVEVYARVSPNHKLRVIDAFTKKARVVAMTGDGVNDAPALKKAAIGIAMGITGTDVSKEASDMILTDDNFVSIIRAVEEGRTIFANIRKFLTYLLTCNMGAVLAYVVAMLGGLPLPLTALQILFINLIMDGPLAITLGLELPEPGIMKQPPRNPKANILNRHSLFYIFGVGFWICAVVLGVFIWAMGEGKEYAMTMFFVTLIMLRTFNAFNCRSATSSLFKLGLLTNRWLIPAFLLTMFVMFSILYVPFLQKIFEVVPLNLKDWSMAFLASVTVLIVVEITKFLQVTHAATGGTTKG
ncbi:P-type Ca2+ transporter type 2C [Candidatus Hakubella thermalkaliphila]|uniref:Probable cation-transporting ATPase F n=2 Tax=Candidatus Hakubella thermalkaliphila TaxID=2754717 RepID=A0A6V8P329_9ACTN|nr:cation-translocating P-type ATPase [Candidatus Hakubella thermalkaliphila]GFP26952.1 P-type Ca2+ transporter type 2C [Candidatus Hakubella thermalkaliphila]GFP35369.1 P-type Ca2+ transporter type 2C [Candidatus Hakubella thermalkaliphila]